MVYRDNPEYKVVAFTATQIPDIAGRCYPAALAGKLYPEGIPIVPESGLKQLLVEQDVDLVVFSYSDVPHLHVMHKASLAVATGADFALLGTGSTCLKSCKPVVAVCAVRTGVGKSQTTRKVAEILKKSGAKVAVIRHPMPYGDLVEQAVQRFADLDDLDRYGCTIEEREEYEPHIEQGNVVYAGVDYEAILRKAESEADVILWDGGNNDLPFIKPDLHITLVDPHRCGHETSYHPGEANLIAADVVIINKVDTAEEQAVLRLREVVKERNPKAAIIEAASPIKAEDPAMIEGKRVLVVEDGPTLTHGEMAYGAGVIAAKRCGAAELIDPRPYAVGSIVKVFEDWPQLGNLLPAMGYSPVQLDELRRTISASPAELLVVGTPIDLGRVLKLDIPDVRVRYSLEPLRGPDLEELVRAAVTEKSKV